MHGIISIWAKWRKERKMILMTYRAFGSAAGKNVASLMVLSHGGPTASFCISSPSICRVSCGFVLARFCRVGIPTLAVFVSNLTAVGHPSPLCSSWHFSLAPISTLDYKISSLRLHEALVISIDATSCRHMQDQVHNSLIFELNVEVCLHLKKD